MEKFDKIFFINLEHRNDRMENIKNFIKKFGLTNYEILKATYLPDNGAKGCSHSHYRIMVKAIEQNLNNILVIEDDYFIDEDIKSVNHKINQIFKCKEWDVIMFFWLLNGVEKRSVKINQFFRKITHKKYGGSSTLCYGVNKNMFSILRDLFLKSYETLDNNYNHEQKKFKTDAIWLLEQNKYNWYIFYPKLGAQIETKSDIHCW